MLELEYVNFFGFKYVTYIFFFFFNLGHCCADVGCGCRRGVIFSIRELFGCLPENVAKLFRGTLNFCLETKSSD